MGKEMPDITGELNHYLELVNPDNIPVIMDSIKKRVQNILENVPEGKEKKARQKIETIRVIIQAKIDQIVNNPDFASNRTKTPKEFQESGRTVSKLLQKIFTDEQDLQKDCEIQDVVINPERITDTMLENFGFDEFIPRNNGKTLPAPEKMQLRANAIPHIKEFFADKLEPFELGISDYLRLFRINSGKKEGLVLGTVGNETAKTLFVTELESSYRRIDHIRKGYQEEIAELRDFETIIKTRSEEIRKNWNEVKSTPRLNQIKKEFFDIVEKMQFVRDPDKKEMKNRIERSLSFKDSRGKVNPGSKMAILAPLGKFVTSRIARIANISAHLEKDQTLLFDEMRKETSRMSDFYNEVELHKDKLKILRPDMPMDDQQRTKVLVNFRGVLTKAETFQFEPYLTMSKLIVKELEKLIDVLENRYENESDRISARESFIRIYATTKLIELQRSLFSLRTIVFNPQVQKEFVYLEAVIKELENIKSKFDERRITPRVDVKEFDGIYAQASSKLAQMLSVCKRGLQKNKGKTEEDKRERRTQTLNWLDDMLGKFNLSELIKNERQEEKSPRDDQPAKNQPEEPRQGKLF